jgi:hypothetical protein
MERWERRERKRKAERERMPKTGMSVRLINEIMGRRAAETRKKGATASPPAPPESRAPASGGGKGSSGR